MLLWRESLEAQARIGASEREMWSQRSCMQSTPAVLKAVRNCTQQVRTESAPMLKPEPASTLLPQRSAMTDGHSAWSSSAAALQMKGTSIADHVYAETTAWASSASLALVTNSLKAARATAARSVR